jgi:hypothetical protein
MIAPGTNLQNFPNIDFSKDVCIVIPTGTKKGKQIFFSPDAIFDNSYIIGLKFNPKELCNRPIYSTTETATEAEGLNTCITLVEKDFSQRIKDMPVMVFNSRQPGNYANRINKLAKLDINLVKSFLTWTGADTTKDLYFYFTFYYIKR